MQKYFSETGLKVFHAKLHISFHLRMIIDTVNYHQLRMREKSSVLQKAHLVKVKCFSLHYSCSELPCSEEYMYLASVFSFYYF